MYHPANLSRSSARLVHGCRLPAFQSQQCGAELEEEHGGASHLLDVPLVLVLAHLHQLKNKNRNRKKPK